MRGAITGKDVVVHGLGIVRLWGATTYLKCLWAAITGRPRTFLDVLYPPPPARASVAVEPLRAARPGAIVLVAAVSRSEPAPLNLGPLSGGPRWRLSR